MIWLGLVVLAVVTMAPLTISLRRAGQARSRREAALVLHRAQLEELDRELGEQRIAPAEHATAVLEVQRRLLAAHATIEPEAPVSSRRPLLIALVLVPVAGLALYLPGASPDMPALPYAARVRAFEARQRRDAQLVAELRRKIATFDPKSPEAREGEVLLGNAEAGRGNLPGAIEAWQQALANRFDPVLAAQIGEAMTEIAGHVTPEARKLFEAALAQAPADAPWRGMIEQRIQEGQGTPSSPGLAPRPAPTGPASAGPPQ